MKQSQVYLSSKPREYTNNQDCFVTNQYLDHITEQKETNLHLMASFSGLQKSCLTILDNIQKQDANFNAHKNKERQYHLQLKNILRKISLATQAIQDSSANQEGSIQKIMDQLTKQAEVSSKLQNSIIHQRASLKNLASHQNNYFEHIMKWLEEQDIRQKTLFEKQYGATQGVLEKINMQNVRLQHKFGKLDGFYETATNQFEENKSLNITILEKQDASELGQQQLMLNMEAQGIRQEQVLNDVKDLLRKLKEAKGSINKLLSSLPTNYPIKQLVVSGEKIPVRSFVMSNENTGVAIFSNDTESIYVAIDKIEAIYWT